MFPIAWITLRRITEKAVLVQFGILALVLAYVALGLDVIVLNDANGTEQSGLMVASLFLTAFTVFWTTIEIPREMHRKEVQVYLSKPVSRIEYLLGKFFGMAGMIIGGELLLLIVFAGCLMIKGQRPSMWFGFTAARTALFLVLLNALCTAVSVALAEVPAMVLVGIVGALGTMACVLPVIAWSGFDRITTAALTSVYFLVPDLLHYRWDPSDGHLMKYLAGLLAYTAGWSTLFMLGGHFVLRQRDLG